jgi:E3 ubiquitin-protein ligase DOA10
MSKYMHGRAIPFLRCRKGMWSITLSVLRTLFNYQKLVNFHKKWLEFVVVLCSKTNYFKFQSMFDATLKDRKTSFHVAPGTSMFIHWLVGMVYVFYFASFILLLREVLRPGVLWFLRNLNDPEFNPIQEVCAFLYCMYINF